LLKQDFYRPDSVPVTPPTVSKHHHHALSFTTSVISLCSIKIVYALYGNVVKQATSTKYYYRQDAAKRQTAGIKFTHRPKIRFFAPQGRLVAPIHVKLGTADVHLGPLGCAKFHLNRRRGWECGPKISKISTFW